VKQKENIFEELNKMRSLIHTKPGVVISEQANAGADVGTIMRELDNFNSDEQKIVNIVKKYKDKASFKNFTDQYKAISGKDFGTDVFRAIQPYNDKTEWADLSNHLKSMGITLGTATTNRGNSSMATLTGLDTPAATTPAAGTRTPEAMKTITSTFCGVRNGKITAGYFKDQPWTSYKSKYSVTDAEEQEAKKTCPTAQTGIVSGGSRGSRSGGGNSQVVTDYSKQIQTSLGSSPTGKMSSQDLDLILKALEGEGISGEAPQSLPMDANGKPDLDKIIASL
jgi:hypothetical protein